MADIAVGGPRRFDITVVIGLLALAIILAGFRAAVGAVVGLADGVTDQGATDTADPAEDTCTTTTYASNTSTWLLDLPADSIRFTTAPRDAEWSERYFHLTDPDGHELSFARPLRSAGQ